MDPSGHWPKGWRNWVEDIFIWVGTGVVATILLPVEAPALVVIGTGIVVGAFVSAATTANDYRWDHPDQGSWSNEELLSSMLRSAVVGGVIGGIGGPPVFKQFKSYLTPREPWPTLANESLGVGLARSGVLLRR